MTSLGWKVNHIFRFIVGWCRLKMGFCPVCGGYFPESLDCDFCHDTQGIYPSHCQIVEAWRENFMASWRENFKNIKFPKKFLRYCPCGFPINEGDITGKNTYICRCCNKELIKENK